MELQKLAMLIAEEFVAVLEETLDRICGPDDEVKPKVMTAGSC